MEDDDAELVAWQGTNAKRPRSKSLARARKRAAGTLRSQQEVPEYAEPLPFGIEDKETTFPWPDNDVIKGKAFFRRYYRLQRIVSKEEWDTFEDALFKPLPVTFRYAGSATAEFRQRGERLLLRLHNEGYPVRDLGIVDGWQLDGVDKHTLRRAEADSAAATLRQWLIEGTDGGMLVRQEVASMLPAALAQVEPSHLVIDMCAAPGSKTTHIVYSMTRGLKDGESLRGLMVANDNDPVRSYTLVKRCFSALGAATASVLVTCHNAQRFPRVLAEDGAAGAGTYDRIICDVPCTGDGTVRTSGHEGVHSTYTPLHTVTYRYTSGHEGAHSTTPPAAAACSRPHDPTAPPPASPTAHPPIAPPLQVRKNPEVFARWEPELAFRMHELQLQIALRAVSLLKVGGRMMYSTCCTPPAVLLLYRMMCPTSGGRPHDVLHLLSKSN